MNRIFVCTVLSPMNVLDVEKIKSYHFNEDSVFTKAIQSTMCSKSVRRLSNTISLFHGEKLDTKLYERRVDAARPQPASCKSFFPSSLSLPKCYGSVGARSWRGTKRRRRRTFLPYFFFFQNFPCSERPIVGTSLSIQLVCLSWAAVIVLLLSCPAPLTGSKTGPSGSHASCTRLVMNFLLFFLSSSSLHCPTLSPPFPFSCL